MDFGDGNSASSATANHTYQSSSVFNATLKVTDSSGKSSQSIFTINVRPTASKFSPLSIISTDLRTNEKIEGSFLLRDQYSNVYDPEIVAVDALITQPNQTTITVPCFYYQQAKYAPDQWVVTTQNGHWRLRFTSDQAGEHSIQLRLKDAEGETLSDSKKVTLTAGNAKGIVKMDAANKQYYRHTTGEPYYPLGINAGWGTTSNYTTILNNLGEGGANLVRYWQVPFDRQALEWRAGSGFYQGLGKYSQEAAAEQDSMIALCGALDIQLQIVLFQHGMFSETVDSNWGDNPYNAANGGPLLFSEQYFSDPTAKAYTKKLLRYIVARWGYSRHLFAWELFNEVHFTGNHPSQTPNWYPAVRAWHDEMGQYIKSLDAFDHIVSSSSSDSHVVDFDKLQGLDNVQYHLYNPNLLSVQIARDRDLLSKMTRTGLICGEYGLDVTTADVPFDVQRLSIWTGIMTQVPHLMWKWENYMDPEWANLFKYPNLYLQQEDFATEGSLLNWAFTTMASVSGLGVVGMQSSKNFYGLVYDINHRSNLAGVEAVLPNLPGGNYTITYFDALTGATIEADKDLKSNDRLALPTFSKAVAFKLKFNFPIVLGFDNISDALKINIFPNPTADVVNIAFDNSTERVDRVRLISTLGVEHFVGTSLPTSSEGYQFRLGNIGIPSGVYILQIETDHTIYSHRIIYTATN